MLSDCLHGGGDSGWGLRLAVSFRLWGAYNEFMRGLAVRMVVALAILGSWCPSPCQSGLPDAAPPQSSASVGVYQAFFSEVAGLIEAANRPRLIGEDSSQPTPKDAIGLTDQEARILNELAASCRAEHLLLNDAVRQLTWERRMRAMESEKVAEEFPRKLKELDHRRILMVLDHLKRLQVAFGEARFQTLDAFVRSREKAGVFFPTDPTGRPVVMKKAAPKK